MKTSNTLRIINACHSMTDCDIQRSWDLLTTRSSYHSVASSQRMARAFAEAVRFYAHRYDGQFTW